jgi:hypothetical protein
MLIESLITFFSSLKTGVKNYFDKSDKSLPIMAEWGLLESVLWCLMCHAIGKRPINNEYKNIFTTASHNGKRTNTFQQERELP